MQTIVRWRKDCILWISLHMVWSFWSALQEKYRTLLRLRLALPLSLEEFSAKTKSSEPEKYPFRLCLAYIDQVGYSSYLENRDIMFLWPLNKYMF